eukprot:461109-Amphidinium_carterae.1
MDTDLRLRHTQWRSGSLASQRRPNELQSAKPTAAEHSIGCEHDTGNQQHARKQVSGCQLLVSLHRSTTDEKFLLKEPFTRITQGTLSPSLMTP